MPGKLELCQLHLAAGLVGVPVEHVLQVLSGGGVEIQAVAQGPGGGDTHSAHRVIEQRLDGRSHRAILQHGFERADGAFTYERMGMPQLGGDGRLYRRLVNPAVQQQGGAGLPVGDFIAAEQIHQSAAGGLIPLACLGD